MLFFHALFLNSSFRYALKFRFLVVVVLNQLNPDLGRLVTTAMATSSTKISKNPTQDLFPSKVLAKAFAVDWWQPFCNLLMNSIHPAFEKCFWTSGCVCRKDRLSNSFLSREPLRLLVICSLKTPTILYTNTTNCYSVRGLALLKALDSVLSSLET